MARCTRSSKQRTWATASQFMRLSWYETKSAALAGCTVLTMARAVRTPARWGRERGKGTSAKEQLEVACRLHEVRGGGVEGLTSSTSGSVKSPMITPWRPSSECTARWLFSTVTTMLHHRVVQRKWVRRYCSLPAILSTRKILCPPQPSCRCPAGLLLAVFERPADNAASQVAVAEDDDVIMRVVRKKGGESLRVGHLLDRTAKHGQHCAKHNDVAEELGYGKGE